MNEGSKLLFFLLLYTEFCLGFLCAHGLAGKPCDAKLLVLLAESVPVTIISLNDQRRDVKGLLSGGRCGDMLKVFHKSGFFWPFAAQKFVCKRVWSSHFLYFYAR